MLNGVSISVVITKPLLCGTEPGIQWAQAIAQSHPAVALTIHVVPIEMEIITGKNLPKFGSYSIEFSVFYALRVHIVFATIWLRYKQSYPFARTLRKLPR